MQKKNKTNTMNRTPKHEIDLPEIINMDDIAYASDSDLHRQYDYLNEDKNRAIQWGCDPTPWEVELAYIQREFDVRRTRAAAHERYVRSNPEAVDAFAFDSNDNAVRLPN